MRRSEKEVKDAAALEIILKKAKICRLAMCNGTTPYIVPMNFGYKEGILYFHSATEGKKLDILRENPLACFEAEADVEIVAGREVCNWSMKYLTVIGHGEAVFIESQKEKAEALGVIVEKYAGRQGFEFPEAALNKVVVFKIKIQEMTGKKSGY